MNRTIHFHRHSLRWIASTIVVACLVHASSLRAQPTKPPAKTTGLTGVLSEEEFKELHQLSREKRPAAMGKHLLLGTHRAYLSVPRTKQTTSIGIVLIHEWWGLNDHIRYWADRLAALGYTALAVDLYRNKEATTPDEAMALMKQVDAKTSLAILSDAVTYLRTDPAIKASKVASIGWCFGGGWSLQLALSETKLDGAVIFYGQLVTDVSQLRKLKMPLLGIFGNRDKGIPPGVVDEFERALKQAKVTHRIVRYDAEHAFANPSSARYDQRSATQAWQEVQTFLQKLRIPVIP